MVTNVALCTYVSSWYTFLKSNPWNEALRNNYDKIAFVTFTLIFFGLGFSMLAISSKIPRILFSISFLSHLTACALSLWIYLHLTDGLRDNAIRLITEKYKSINVEDLEYEGSCVSLSVYNDTPPEEMPCDSYLTTYVNERVFYMRKPLLYSLSASTTTVFIMFTALFVYFACFDEGETSNESMQLSQIGSTLISDE